ncbi:MAG: 16S rRNA (cytidine(1402)-2'-O)-methyltransferase [Dialister sp.]|nr:16S rRNA (cytidine(1402)-2'-O)-methyltransferase [Dialister sp.]
MNEIIPGTLYLVPTPIGNISDMTERAMHILQQADVVACEDTRHTGLLLHHLGVRSRLLSYHEHNKHEAGPRIIQLLEEGSTVALCSDAGMPVISDPGAELVRLAIDAGISVVPLPGPNAALTALIASGLDSRQFLFVGFLPKTNGKKERMLAEIKTLRVTLIFYEAPHRIKRTMRFLLDRLGNRPAVLARELTKKFETFQRGTLEELTKHLEMELPRGEYVILVAGTGEDTEADLPKDKGSWQEEAVTLAESHSVKEVSRLVAAKWDCSRREVYQFLLREGK